MITTTDVKCANCGKKVTKYKAEITRQKKKGKTNFYCNRSCAGKSSCSHLKQYNKINSKYLKADNRKDQYTEFKWYMKCIIKNSKKKQCDYDVDLSYLKELWDAQKGICPFTKEALSLRTHNYEIISDRVYQASLDRIDNNKGYIKGNIRFVSLMFNYARNNFSDSDVIEFCKKVTKNH